MDWKAKGTSEPKVVLENKLIESKQTKRRRELENLPLDWTRIKRKPLVTDEKNLCKDDECPCDPRSLPIEAFFKVPSYPETLKGVAIFCVHDTAASWFQGYFLPERQSNGFKAMGLLSEERMIDDCLQCDDGGYRELNITLTTFQKSNLNNNSENPSLHMTVMCTGGDMFQMRPIAKSSKPMALLEFDATVVLTDFRAEKYFKTYFGSLLQQRQNELIKNKLIDSDDDDMTPLSLFPNCSIVIGRMTLSGSASIFRQLNGPESSSSRAVDVHAT